MSSHTPSSMILASVLRLETLRRLSRIAVALPDTIREKTLERNFLNGITPRAYPSFGPASEHGGPRKMIIIRLEKSAVQYSVL